MTIWIERARVGRPDSAAVLAVVAGNRAWVYSPEYGLLSPRGLSRGAGYELIFGENSLSPDGRFLSYEEHHRNGFFERVDQVRYDVAAGAAEVGERWPHFEDGASSVRMRHVVDTGTHPTRTIYELRDGSCARTLPIEDLCHSNWTGSPLQFSPDRRRIAVSAQAGPGEQCVVVLDLDTDEVRRYPGVMLASSGAWNPDTGRLLVAEVSSADSFALDLVTGERAPVRSRIHYDGRGHFPSVIGWLTARTVLFYRAIPSIRRIKIASFDLDTGVESQLLELPMTAGAMSLLGVFMAPRLFLQNPSLLD
ncbi:hypothetical protein GCM10027515_13500 [Schumannella luteola]|uniref:Uncharacterized protein n=1 Tax=Schumannella luteola TaxID=472059 RepID=A0A852YDR2_9MICO|nr:hypothetical protein [Schumannella luteola]NYG97797.1 hypothetical protein [Schumannella luteola]TPX02938.1 hypothetical protein FJ656_19975 [Schumannella luteola]